MMVAGAQRDRDCLLGSEQARARRRFIVVRLLLSIIVPMA